MNEENVTMQFNANISLSLKIMLLCVLLNKPTVFLLHPSIHYFCWTRPFVWKALSWVALVFCSSSSRWKQQPKRSRVRSHSHSHSSPSSSALTNATGLCKLSSHAPLSIERHIFGMKEILNLLFLAFVRKQRPLLTVLFVCLCREGWGHSHSVIHVLPLKGF